MLFFSNWHNQKKSRTTTEKNDESIRPEIKNKVNNINEYSKIVIGFPVWWYKEPSIIDTFIEENDLSKHYHLKILQDNKP